ncbi:hypothetical protein BDA99DRAFT_561658 [Phascolomyces articulosus]|uniref:Uncharacterized protein n=1 Tax=Phascolomyces articulosus TaxID=60185 RepID=A0AAD5K612_9FUNG|nr:hypothetical protein BDA99DRAFT_561658 [Phascolomyces articulosus]
MANKENYTLLFTRIQQWIPDTANDIIEPMQSHEKHHNLCERIKKMANNNDRVPMDSSSEESGDGEDGRFLILQEKHRQFEHFLLCVKFQLAIEKYIINNKCSSPADDPERSHTLIAITRLEKIIQVYLILQAEKCCYHRILGDELEEGNIVIESDSAMMHVAARKEKESKFQEEHRIRALELEDDLKNI